MIKNYLMSLLVKNRIFLLDQSIAIKGFMQLLMKPRNTGEKWTKEEKKEIRKHLKTMALAVPALIIFLPPGGSILLPLLVDVLDRRKNTRPKKTQPARYPASNEAEELFIKHSGQNQPAQADTFRK